MQKTITDFTRRQTIFPHEKIQQIRMKNLRRAVEGMGWNWEEFKKEKVNIKKNKGKKNGRK